MWCGPRNCLMSVNQSELVTTCSNDEECVIQSSVECFTSLCLPWGVCQGRNIVAPTEIAPTLPDTCNDDGGSSLCSSLTLVFDKRLMPLVS